MPAVQQYIAQILGHEIAKDSRPDTAIALGAGICAGMKERAADLKELVLTDVCPFTLGIASYNRAEPDRPLMSPLIERNCVLPSSKEGEYYTVHDDQNAITIQIYQGENLYCADNTLLGSLNIQVPKTRRERQSVRIRFTYDINGILDVEAVNKNGEKAQLILQNQEMQAEEVARRLQVLSTLKLHPREQEIPRALIARAERLYVATVGGLRVQVYRMLEWYQSILDRQDRLLVAKASRRVERFLNQVEAWIGDDGLLNFNFNLPSGDEEDEE